MNESQLRWQCRHGMRELDILLTDYLDKEYPQADERQKRAFRELLSLPDRELIAYMLGGETPRDCVLASIVRTIRGRPHS